MTSLRCDWGQSAGHKEYQAAFAFTARVQRQWRGYDRGGVTAAAQIEQPSTPATMGEYTWGHPAG